MKAVPTDPSPRDEARYSAALRIALVYAAVGLAWIFVTDLAVERIWQLENRFPRAQTLKGTVFVLGSAGLVYVLVRRERRAWERAADELEESRKLLESTFRSLDDALFVTELPDRTIAGVNPAAERMFGRTRSELLGASTRVLCPSEESWRRFEASALSVVAESGIYRGEWEFQRADGSVFPAMVSLSAIRNQDEAFVATVGVVWDLSERKAREQEIRETRDLLEGVLENLHDALFLVDPDERTIISCNRAAERLTGYTRSELEGRPTRILYPSEDLYEEVTREIDRRRASGGAYRMEGEIRRKDGSIVPVEGVISTARPEHRDRAVEIAVARDISERKTLEDELRSSRDRIQRYALRLQAVREEERHAVARDLHDQLGGSLTALGMLLARLRPALDGDEVSQALIEEMEIIASDALDDVRRITAQLRPPVLEELGLVAALQDLVAEVGDRSEVAVGFEPTAGESELDLNEEAAVHLYRIAQEALTNVVRHAEAHACRVVLSRDATTIGLAVEDDGVGIGWDGISEAGEGTGLIGMRERTRALGGSLEIRPTEGGGTRVAAVIPLEGNRKKGRRDPERAEADA